MTKKFNEYRFEGLDYKVEIAKEQRDADNLVKWAR